MPTRNPKRMIKYSSRSYKWRVESMYFQVWVESAAPPVCSALVRLWFIYACAKRGEKGAVLCIASDLHNFVASYHPLSLSFLAAHFILIADAPSAEFFYRVASVCSKRSSKKPRRFKRNNVFPDLHRGSSGGKYILLCSSGSGKYFNHWLLYLKVYLPELKSPAYFAFDQGSKILKNCRSR